MNQDKQPLQVNAGDTSDEQRRSLIQKYQTDLNQNDLDYTHDTEKELNQLKTDLAKTKRKRMFIIGGVAGAAIILLIVIIAVVAGGKKPDPDIPPTPENPIIVNPWILTADAKTDAVYGTRTFNLKRNTNLVKFNSKHAKVTETNTFIDEAIISLTADHYSTTRLSIVDKQYEQYRMPEDMLAPGARLTAKKTGLNVNDLAVKVAINPSYNSKTGGGSPFNINMEDLQTKENLINTLGMNFYMMTQYQEIQFNVNSQKIFGLGERGEDNGFLAQGIYVLYPQISHLLKNIKADANTKILGDYAPFLVFQTAKGKFFGMYLFSSQPMEIQIDYINEGRSLLTIRTTGGVFDFFFFNGPHFQDVLRQFQSVVNMPELPPAWTQGFFAKSSSYSTGDDSALQNIQSYIKERMPIQGVILTSDSLGDGLKNFGFDKSVDNIKKAFPDMPIILPFTHAVPLSTPQVDLDKLLKAGADGDTNLVVTYNDANLQVQIKNFAGKLIDAYCMDVFHPDIAELYFKPLFKDIDQTQYGFWLDSNFPRIDKLVLPEKPEKKPVNPFDAMPFIPGGIALGEGTLPINAVHKTAKDDSDYHLDVHSQFGTRMANQIRSTMKSAPGLKPFLMSDSLLPNSPSVAHLTSQTSGKFTDLQKQISALVNHMISNTPLVSPSICDFDTTTVENQELCARHFQLSVISPLAIYNDIQSEANKHKHPFDFETDYKNSVLNSLQTRFRFMVYQRTQLFIISKLGGSLVSPLFTHYPTDTKINVNDFSTVMYGHAIKVDFATQKGQSDKDIYFPGTKWVNLDSFEIYKNKEAWTTKLPMTLDRVAMFQNGQGTVVPIQQVRHYDVKKIEDLRKVPIQLSISLDDKGHAWGHVLIEEGAEEEGKTEFYEIKAANNMIQFKQMNSGVVNSEVNQISKIYVSFYQGEEPTVVCALKRDLITVQPLFISSHNDKGQQIAFQAADPTNPEDQSIMKINDLAYIFYGKSLLGTKCDESLFKRQLEGNVKVDEQNFEATFSQNIAALIGKENAPNQSIKIKLLSDNSIHVSISPTDSKLETPNEIFDRTFKAETEAEKKVSLKDILIYTPNPFCFELVKPGTHGQEVLFSTCDLFLLHMKEMNLFQMTQRISNQDRFFGLGERKSDFFLQDHYTYVVYNNDNNVPNQKLSNDRVVEATKNGFFPVIYSQLKNSQNLNAILMFTTHAVEVNFYKWSSMDDPIPRLAILSASNDLEYSFVFNAKPERAVEVVYDHVQLGSLRKTEKKFQLPPPIWSFGHHHMVLDEEDLANFVVSYLQETKFPIEGLAQDIPALDNFKSYSLNGKLFTATTIEKLQMMKKSLITVSKSGFASSDPHLKYITDNNLQLKDANGDSVVGFDQSGKLTYVDYSKDAETLITTLINDIKYPKLGVRLINNEISTPQCEMGLCSWGKLNFFTAGNYYMWHNTMMTGQRAFGNEDALHNVNGLMEQIRYANAIEKSKLPRMPVISESTSIGSGRLGNVARNFDYYTPAEVNLAIQNIQALSIMGLPQVGANFDFRANEYQKDVLAGYVKQTVMVNAFQTSTSIQNLFFRTYRDLSVDDKKDLILLQRYKYAFLAYSRTQVFRQINYGTPFIRPLFFDTNEPDAINFINKQYLFGRAIQFSVDWAAQRFYPVGTWCSLKKLSKNSVCFEGPTTRTDNERMIPIRSGSIMPVYTMLGEENPDLVFTGSQDLEKQSLHLHIHNDFTAKDVQAIGQILIDSDDAASTNDYCYFTMSQQGLIITVTDNSAEAGATGKCKDYPGFMLSEIYVYNFKIAGYKLAKLNDQIEFKLDSSDEMVGVYSLDKPIHMSEVKTITFNK